ncbi:hypothetical protein ACSV4D_12360 [Flavobacterium sp. ARAG 55.4]|uniref:hypothetical protein n=1 Tax=Flavobacterium sp. ARAG 55.4 TaxID=3451357 RepID=UPI003F48F1C7
MRNWLNNRFGINLNEEDLTSVKDFALIWNVFDSYVCLSNFSIATTEQELQQHQFDINDFQRFLDYFKNRYVTNSTLNGRFQHLNFRQSDRQELVAEVLLGNNENVHDIILAMVIIVYRFRNNLFHGVKDIQVIDEQKDNFKNANELLQLLLEKINT